MITVITVLLFIILAASFWQPTPQRLYAALVASALTTWHHWGYFDVSGLAYYGTAALADLAIIAALSFIDTPPKMVLRLQTICVVSIMLNVAGWILWRMYMPPDLYNAAYVMLYAWMLITLIRRGKTDHVGGYRNGFGGSSYGCSPCARGILDLRDGGAL